MGSCQPRHPAAAGPAPPRCGQEVPAGCCGLWTHPASPAQGQRKGLFLFAGAVGSGTHLPPRPSSGKTRPCLGAAASCPPRRRGDSPAADTGLCSGRGPSWVGEFCARCRVLLQRKSCLSLGWGGAPLLGMNPPFPHPRGLPQPGLWGFGAESRRLGRPPVYFPPVYFSSRSGRAQPPAPFRKGRDIYSCLAQGVGICRGCLRPPASCRSIPQPRPAPGWGPGPDPALAVGTTLPGGCVMPGVPGGLCVIPGVPWGSEAPFGRWEADLGLIWGVRTAGITPPPSNPQPAAPLHAVPRFPQSDASPGWAVEGQPPDRDWG